MKYALNDVHPAFSFGRIHTDTTHRHNTHRHTSARSEMPPTMCNSSGVVCAVCLRVCACTRQHKSKLNLCPGNRVGGVSRAPGWVWCCVFRVHPELDAHIPARRL